MEALENISKCLNSAKRDTFIQAVQSKIREGKFIEVVPGCILPVDEEKTANF